MGKAIVWLLAGGVFFLGLWIVLPAPNLFFLRLAVGAPEISPLLGLIAVGLLLVTLWRYRRKLKPARLLMAMLVIALALSSLPLLQLPGAVA